jgi:hypothetical protein
MVSAVEQARRWSMRRWPDTEYVRWLRRWGETPLATVYCLQRWGNLRGRFHLSPADFASWTDADLLLIPGIGRKRLAEIREAAA